MYKTVFVHYTDVVTFLEWLNLLQRAEVNILHTYSFNYSLHSNMTL